MNDSKEKPAIIRLKERLQFTGWLQYLPVFTASLSFALIAGLTRFLFPSYPKIFQILLGIAVLLLIRFFWELLTFKAGVRLPDKKPETQESDDEIDIVLSRTSCRSFHQTDLTDSDSAAIRESVERHTSGIRFEYVKGPLTVWPVVGAREFLVAIAPAEYSRKNVIEVGRSGQQIVLDATKMGVATCWIGPGANHESVLRYLGDRFDADRDHIICLLAIGPGTGPGSFALLQQLCTAENL